VSASGSKRAVGALIQARMSSVRLPGKVLLEVAGEPLIARVFDRLGGAESLDSVLVVTSLDPSDDPLADYCERRAIPFRRGSLDDVAGRLLGAAEAEGLDALVRISGDSPLIDPALVDRAVSLYAEGGAELVSNVYPERSFPTGQSIEVIAVEALSRAHRQMSEAEDREHVTPYLYANPGQFRIRGFSHIPPVPEVRFTVDSNADHERLERLISSMAEPPSTYPLERLLELERGLSSLPGGGS